MVSVVYCIVLLCLTSGLWMEAEIAGSCRRGWTRFGCRFSATGLIKRTGLLLRFSNDNHIAVTGTLNRHCIYLGGNLASIQSTREYYQIRWLVRELHTQIEMFGLEAMMVFGRERGCGAMALGLASDTGAGGSQTNYRRREDCMEMNFRGRNYVNDANCRDRLGFVCSSFLE
ncbi:hypothetical protein F7725_026017 [Dissostichus mawsoni]|uniref:C-type lectin domain-containing protein n=1 Tax=Dissostichus mawsoni TaxID=36200 RepID=A0A7J5X5W8_DISMA|nr:hypothetical protein F7725_026017 [Dissostichus mawsoni]